MNPPRKPGEDVRCARVALGPIRQVVVGMSLLESSESVVAAAVALTEAVHGRLTVVHSVPTDALMPSLSADWQQANLQERWFELQREEATARVERLGNPVPLEARIESGPPHRAILATAKKVGADLIVIGASDRGRFARILGGTADRILRQAECPVLVVRGDWKTPIERVLMPVDFSPLSADAYDCGLCFLSQVGAPDPKIELFYARSEYQGAAMASIGAQRLDAFLTRELERFGRESAAGFDFEPSYRTGAGAPAREILKEADRFGADLVVVGTNGQGGFERALIGSVAKAVATEAQRPVLFIPPEVALGASIAEAVLEQTAPRWPAAGTADPSTQGAESRGAS